MLHLNAEQTRAALPMISAITAMEHAFSGASEAPLRSLVGGSLVMPGRLGETVAVKVVSIVPGNPAGLVVVFGRDGAPIGIVDGPTLTAIRTGAACGLATRLIAPQSASTLGMLGAGAMASDQIEAVRAVRGIERVLIWSRSLDNAERLADMVGGEAFADADEVVAASDIVSCATPATKPLFSSEAIRPGMHFNAVGAFTPEMSELPAGLLEDAFVVVDDIDAAAAEAGDLIQAGRLPDATLRDVLTGAIGATPGQATVFKSVGVAAQDVAAASAALERASQMGIGTRL